MGPTEWLLLRAELIVAAVAILGALKSVYNGWLRRHVFQPLERVEEIDHRTERLERNQEDMKDQQENLTDAVVALGRSHEEDGRDFDVDNFKQQTGRRSGSDDFLQDD